VFKIVPQILAFLSLAVIVFIFARNIKKINEAPEEVFLKKEQKSPNIIKRFFGKIKSFLGGVTVSFLEWAIKKAKKILHLIHFWVIKLRIKKGDDDNEKELAAKNQLLAEEEENLESVIKEDLGIEEEKMVANVGAKKGKKRGIFSRIARKAREEKRGQEEEAKDIQEQQKKEQQDEKILEVGFKEEESGIREEDIAKKAMEGIDKEKESKLRRFFDKEEEKNNLRIEEKEELEIDKESEILISEEELGLKRAKPKGFWVKTKKLWRVFSFGKKGKSDLEQEEFSREENQEEEDQHSSAKYNDDRAKMGDEDIQGANNKRRLSFFKKNKRPTNLISEVIEARKVEEEIDPDDELGVDKRILEKKIILKITKDPKNVENYRQLGEFYIKIKNYEDATSSYKQILKMKPRDVDAKRKLEKIKLLKRLN